MNENTFTEIIRLAKKHLSYPIQEETQLLDLKRVVDELEPEDLDLAQKMSFLNREIDWSCEALYYASNFHINLLMIPKGNQIPLHDHPEMHVFLKVLWGKVHIKSFDWAEEYPFQGLARLVKNQVYNGADETVIIQPKKGNIHQVIALEDCAFLDVLSPYYDEQYGRTCHYYQEQETFHQNGDSLTKLVPI